MFGASSWSYLARLLLLKAHQARPIPSGTPQPAAEDDENARTFQKTVYVLLGFEKELL